MGGPLRITWAEIEAWAALTHTDLQPWEARVLRRLDELWCAAWADGRPDAKRKGH